MPDVRNCRRCGRLFTFLGGAPICQECKQMDEEDFKKIKEYLYENPGASLSLVSSELDISVEKIKRFLKEGRLEITSDEGNIILECEKCGKSIKSGRFCDECERGIASEMKSFASQFKSDAAKLQEVHQKGIGMRYLNKEDKK